VYKVYTPGGCRAFENCVILIGLDATFAIPLSLSHFKSFVVLDHSVYDFQFFLALVHEYKKEERKRQQAKRNNNQITG